jgi:hypothetical protein
MKVELSIRYREELQRPTAAWFVRGSSTQVWLDEMISWQTSLTMARLHILPSGVLVTGVSPSIAAVSPQTMPYCEMLRRLYLPSHAELDPPLNDRELAELLGDELTYVWHPQAGLVAFSPTQVLKVRDLLTVPAISADEWNRAVPGTALNNRLWSIEAAETPNIDDVLEMARDDIGSERPEVDRMPRSPHEASGSILGKLTGMGMLGAAHAAKWLAKFAPANAQNPTWVNKLQDWAGDTLEKISQSMTASRNREIARLLNLLEKSPDEGLRFALPMTGNNRGVAPPSNQLVKRDTNFSLSGLRGSGPADVWDIPFEYQQQLTARYRELAQREIALGRHRRAAYIFASLLGDIAAAATTLADGRHWREAAVLYEQKLNRPEEAARCLRQGGLFSEAIVIYERLGLFETIGDLYQQLEQPDDAVTAWRTAADRRLLAGDRLDAARILERKLSLPEEAYACLVEAWPNPPQAEPCLTEAFALLGRHAYHDKALQLLAELPGRTQKTRLFPTLVENLSTQSHAYPDIGVRRAAVEQTRVVAAEQLEVANEVEARRLAHAVGRLVPEDRLLARDVHRFLQRRKANQPRQLKLTSPGRDKLKLVRELQLPNLDWKVADANSEGLYAAGYRDRELSVVRMAWTTAEVELLDSPWMVEPAQTQMAVLLAVDPLGLAPLVVHPLGSTLPLVTRKFPHNPAFSVDGEVKTHRGLFASSLAAVYSGRETLHVADYKPDHAITISVFVSATTRMQGLMSIDLKEEPAADQDIVMPLPMIVRGGAVCVGLGSQLFFVTREGLPRAIPMPSAIRQLVGSAPHTRPRLAASLDEGAVMLWGETPNAPTTTFAFDMPCPKIAFTRNGWLAAASDQQVEVYRLLDTELQLHARLEHSGGELLSVVTRTHGDSFGLVTKSGQVLTFEIH